MLYQIADGSVSVGGNLILSHIDFEVRGNEKIAVVGRNGAGKTTLLRLIAGELSLDRDDKRRGPGIEMSRRLTIGMLCQQVFADPERTVEEELLANCPARGTFERERFEYEREYDMMFTGFGFAKEDKRRRLGSFSGGEQTKIALIRLLLQKPDILLLDEPTNHLDLEACEWLEQYLREYVHAVVMVSHDRFFLDRTAQVVYEIAGKRLVRYSGNYTDYRREKRKKIALQQKAYDRQQEELSRLEEVIERFKHKPTKAAFARAKKKQIERMERVEKPTEDDVHLFTGEINPLLPGSKWVFDAEHLVLGYDKALLELTIRIRRGQKIGLLGANGAGKTTFLKTIAGLLPPLKGECTLGNQVTIGYFDQHSAKIQSEKSVAEHFHDLFPSMTDKEVRSVLGAYLFRGKEASRKVSELSGGEKARLVLAELLQSRPNFLILDEPTNHMDVQAKETLESAFQAYTGTILFVSHDRYFIRQVAQSVMIFEGQSAFYYPFGYEHYLERSRKAKMGETIAAQVKAEDQALLEGLRAVPKAERRRLREIPTEEAYLDWKLRLVMEKAEPAAEQYGLLCRQCEQFLESWKQSKVWWREYLPKEEQSGQEQQGQQERQGQQEQGIRDCNCFYRENQAEESMEKEYQRLCNERDAAWEAWHGYCMEWLEIWEGEP